MRCLDETRLHISKRGQVCGDGEDSKAARVEGPVAW